MRNLSKNNTLQNATDYLWDLNEYNPTLPENELFSTPTPSYNPSSENIYDYVYGCAPGIITVSLIASNNGICPDTAYLNISIEPDVICYVPNTFTPDGGKFNELFFPTFSHNIDTKNYTFRIFNRWGEVVFETSEAPEIPTTPQNTKGAWNGKLNGKDVQDGVYTWEIFFKAAGTSKDERLVGHVSIIR